MVENIFWPQLWEAVSREFEAPHDESVPIDKHFTEASERLAARVQDDGAGWYRLAGADNPKPLPNGLAIDLLIFATLFGNYLAWRSGINFFDRVKPSQ